MSYTEPESDSNKKSHIEDWKLQNEIPFRSEEEALESKPETMSTEGSAQVRDNSDNEEEWEESQQGSEHCSENETGTFKGNGSASHDEPGLDYDSDFHGLDDLEFDNAEPQEPPQEKYAQNVPNMHGDHYPYNPWPQVYQQQAYPTGAPPIYPNSQTGYPNPTNLDQTGQTTSVGGSFAFPNSSQLHPNQDVPSWPPASVPLYGAPYNPWAQPVTVYPTPIGSGWTPQAPCPPAGPLSYLPQPTLGHHQYPPATPLFWPPPTVPSGIYDAYHGTPYQNMNAVPTPRPGPIQGNRTVTGLNTRQPGPTSASEARPLYTGVAGHNWPTITKADPENIIEGPLDPVYTKPSGLLLENDKLKSAFNRYMRFLKKRVLKQLDFKRRSPDFQSSFEFQSLAPKQPTAPVKWEANSLPDDPGDPQERLKFAFFRYTRKVKNEMENLNYEEKSNSADESETMLSSSDQEDSG